MEEKLTRILYVEDDADIRLIAQIALEEIGGFTVKLCASGQEALADAETFKPEIFLLDVMMPSLDGPTTLLELRKLPSLKHVPAIFITAKVQNSEITQYKKLGIIDVIPKPFDPLTLATTIHELWKNYKPISSSDFSSQS